MMLRLFLGVALAAVAAEAAVAQPQVQPPAAAAEATETQVLERAVRALYDKFFPGAKEDAGALPLPFSDGLSALEAKAADNEAGIPYDYICDCQDYELRDLSVATRSLEAQSATVVARFKNFGEDTRVTYKLIKSPQGWRIDDIISSHGQSQRAVFADMAK